MIKKQPISDMASIHVNYEFIDGHHVLTSDDVKGFLIVSKNARKAFDDVIPSLQFLLKENEGVECSVSPLKSFSEFKALIQHEEKPPYRTRLSNHEYAISAFA